jgi:hypothetical protein
VRQVAKPAHHASASRREREAGQRHELVSRRITAMVDMHWSAKTKNTSREATVAGVNTRRPLRGSTSARIAARSPDSSSLAA